MKKSKIITLIIVTAFCLCACAPKLPSDPVVFSEGPYNENGKIITDGETQYIVSKDNALALEDKDVCIGYMDEGAGGNRLYIFSVKDEPGRLIGVFYAGDVNMWSYEKYEPDEKE